MSKQKEMKARLDELRKENDEIAKRRTERDEKQGEGILNFLKSKFKDIEERPHLAYSMGRGFRRRAQAGTPRSVVFSQKMTIPKKRR
jgi:hypothetical protein